MATTVSHHIPTLQHAIADLTGYEDADTLRWQQACVHAAQQLTGAQGRYAGTDTDRLAQGLDLAQRGGVTLAEALDDLRAEVTSGTAHYTVDLAQPGCPCLDFQQRKAPCMHLLAVEIHTGALGFFAASAPLLPPDTTPPATTTSLPEAPGATASGPPRARRTRTVRTPRRQAPAPTGQPRQLAHQRSASEHERQAQGGHHGGHVHGARYQRPGPARPHDHAAALAGRGPGRV